MKKMKSLVAAVLSFALVITMLSGCTSNGNTDRETTEPTQKPTEVATVEPTEEPTEVATAEPTQEPTEEPTTATAEPAQEDVIISLTSSPFGFGASDPNKLVNWDDFWIYYMFTDANVEYAEMTLYKLDEIDTTGFWMAGYPDTTKSYDFEMYFGEEGGYTRVWYVINGEYLSKTDVYPLFYNQTKGCVVGINTQNCYGPEDVYLVEIYYDEEFESLYAIPVEDPSIYGVR